MGAAGQIDTYAQCVYIYDIFPCVSPRSPVSSFKRIVAAAAAAATAFVVAARESVQSRAYTSTAAAVVAGFYTSLSTIDRRWSFINILHYRGRGGDYRRARRVYAV